MSAWKLPGDAIRRLARLAGLVSIAGLLAVALLSPVGAQETPEPTSTVEPTPGADVNTVVRIEVDQGPAPIPMGEEFEVRVVVENVEHLAGFSFAISYDPKRLEPVTEAGPSEQGGTPEPTPVAGRERKAVRARGLGEFLASSERQDVFCPAPFVEEETDTVTASCVTRAAPLCLDGPPGAAGSGLLGAVIFRSKGGGETTLKLANSDLVLDDAAPPCDPETLTALPIQHRREDATIELAKGDGGSGVLIGVIVAVVVVVVAGGGAGYLWYRRRQAGTAA